MKYKLILAMMAAGISSLVAPDARSDNSDWEVEITPYLWATYQKGTTGERNVRGSGQDLLADFDLDFGDILDNLDGALLLDVAAKRGDWMFISDVTYMKVKDDQALAGPSGAGSSSVELENTQILIDMLGGYRVANNGRSSTYLYGGLRYMDVESEIGLTLSPAGSAAPVGSGSTTVGDDWIDPLTGVFNVWTISDNWSLSTRLEAGGFGVGSELSWLVAVGAHQKIGDNWSIHYGYRYLNVDYDDNDFVLDAEIGGLLLGASYRF